MQNLQDDAELARRTVEAFIRASVTAIPTGKQNSFAAHNPPSLVFAVVRKAGFWSLSNAFEKPVRPTGELSLVQASIKALDTHWGQLVRGYGDDQIESAAMYSLFPQDDLELESTAEYRTQSIQTLIDTAVGALNFGNASGEAT